MLVAEVCCYVAMFISRRGHASPAPSSHRQGHIAPVRCRTRPPRLTVSAPESAQQPQPPLFPQYPFGPFQDPT
jgi:hypothetical protein